MKSAARTMENTTENLRRFPPRSKFNDEESTGVLRLIVEQERLLKNPVNPVLNITSDKLKRLPPLSEALHDSRNAQLENPAFEPKRIHRRPKSNEDRATFLKGALGKPKIPEIYSTPKIARPRQRERPRASYGRHIEIQRNHSEPIEWKESIEEYKGSSTNDFFLDRPSNPTPLQETNKLMDQETVSRTINKDGFEYESEDDLIDIAQIEEKYALHIN